MITGQSTQLKSLLPPRFMPRVMDDRCIRCQTCVQQCGWEALYYDPHSDAIKSIDERCTACHMTMRPQYFLDLKRGESILQCESCQRILFYNPPAAIEDLAGEGEARTNPRCQRAGLCRDRGGGCLSRRHRADGR